MHWAALNYRATVSFISAVRDFRYFLSHRSSVRIAVEWLPKDSREQAPHEIRQDGESRQVVSSRESA